MILALDISTSITGVTILEKDGSLVYNDAWDTRKYKNFFEKVKHVEKNLNRFIENVKESKGYLSSNLSKVSDLDSRRLKLCQLSLVLMGWCHGWYIEYCRLNHNT